MAMEQDKIKDLFSSKLNSFEPEVPASVWGGLDQLLSSQPAPVPEPTSSSSAAAGSTSAIKTIAITVGLAAAIATGIFVLMPDKQEVKLEQPAPVIEEPEVVIDTVQSAVETDTVVYKPVFVPREPIKKDVIEEEEDKVSLEEEDIVEVEELDEEEIIEEEPEPVEEPLLVRKIYEDPYEKTFSIGITGGVGLLSDNVAQRGGDILLSRGIRSAELSGALAEENAEFELKHKQPISFGITIGRSFTPNFSLETGIIYTRLSSELTSNSLFELREKQTFDYIGIPLTLNYIFYQPGKTRFYFSVGGMVQKDIQGILKSNMDFSLSGMEDNEMINEIFYLEPYYIKKTIKQSNPQFSIKTAFGVAYPLYKKLYLYGTIGGVYYFDAGNKYRTIYSDKKAQLDLNLGIKFDF